MANTNLEALVKENTETMATFLQAIQKQNEATNEKFDIQDKKLDDMSIDIRKVKAEQDAMKEDLINNAFITPTEAGRLQRLGAVRVHEILGDSGTIDWETYSNTFFKRMWSEFKKQFGLSKYSETKHKDYQSAVEYIEAWNPTPDTPSLKAKIDQRNQVRREAGLN